MNYRWVPGVKYIAGVTFQSEYGVHEAGTEVEEAPGFQNLEVLVANRFLWPYAPDDGYAWLPPHLFSAVKTREEVKAALIGDPKGSQRVPQWPDEDNPDEDGQQPAVFSQAAFEGEQQQAIREDIKASTQPGQQHPRDPGPSPEEVAEEATADQDKTDSERESRLQRRTPTPRKRKES